MDYKELLSLINNGDPDDPRMKMLSLMMEQQNKVKETTPGDSTTNVEKLKDYIKKLISELKQLRKTNESLVNNIEFLLARNDILTDALGSCSECLGEDPRCETCRGKGKPGYYAISEELYNHYIRPCIRNFSAEELALFDKPEASH